MLRWSNIRAEDEQVVSWCLGQRLQCSLGRILVSAVMLVACFLPGVGQGELLRERGCFQCHLGDNYDDIYREAQLSLKTVTERYRLSYLKVLLSPSPTAPVKKSLFSHSFFLSESERESVLRALSETSSVTQEAWFTVTSETRDRARGTVQNELGCNGCHGREELGSLDDFGARYRVGYARSRLAQVGGTLSKCKHRGRPLTHGAVQTVLTSIANVRNLDVTMTDGAKTPAPTSLSRAQCAACHTADVVPDRYLDLRRVWGHLKPDWIRRFLVEPTPVRRSGVVPGDGRRHPDLRLGTEEVKGVERALKRLSQGQVADTAPPALSADRGAAIHRLISGRYGCTGCHQLDGLGGRIAPSFDGVGARLRASAIRRVLRQPHHYNADSKMPKWQFAHDSGRLDELVAFLANRKKVEDRVDYLPWADLPNRPGEPVSKLSRGAVIYGKHCADCHGESGRGDGFNAPFLQAPPMVHWRQIELGKSTDERLIMGIALGGWVLGKSGQMPGFGGVLTPSDLRAVVQHLRVLCACDAPGWSKDVPQ